MTHLSISDARCTTSTSRPHQAGVLAAAALFACASLAGAQTYPVKTVRLVIPLAPGGGGDIVSRAIAAKLTEQFGQSVIVDNRPGGATIIGTAPVATSPPDAHPQEMPTPAEEHLGCDNRSAVKYLWYNAVHLSGAQCLPPPEFHVRATAALCEIAQNLFHRGVRVSPDG